MDTPDNNPLRGPWTCADGVTVRDADDKIVAVLARGGEDDGTARCQAIAATPQLLTALHDLVQWHGRRKYPPNPDCPGEELVPADQQMPEIGAAMRLLADVGVRL